MAERIYLIDAMAFAFRSYYAIRTALTDTKGRPTNAVYGFTRILLKILREQDPAYIAVVFDAPGKTFRNDLYPEYKATRVVAPDELKEQFPRMHQVAEAMNLPLFVVEGVEADDVIGTLARRAEAEGMEAVAVSGDKDLLQLISDKVCVFDPGKGDAGVWYGREEVVARFGTGPEHVTDALALIGDSSDNVPGVRGIGDKTAKKLMAKYGSLEGLYEHIGELKGKQKEKLEEDRDQAFFSRDLVTIKTDVELERGPRECKRNAPDLEKLIDVFGGLDFQSLLDELLPERQEAEADDCYELITEEKAFTALIEKLKKAGVFALDTETTSTDPMRAQLVGISFCCEKGQAWYVPVSHQPEALTFLRDPDDLTTAERHEQIPRGRALELLRPLLEDDKTGKIGHNIKYDLIVLARAGVQLRGIVMDTMVASYLTDPSRLRHNLDEVSLQYLRRKPIPISDVIGKGAKAVTFDHVPLDRACEYAAEDADMAWRLYEVFSPILKERKLTALFRDVELPLITVLARMAQYGIAIDSRHFELLHGEIEGQLETLQNRIFESAGEPFNINSPKQLQVILFERLGLKPIRKTRTGYSTDMDVLEQLSRYHPLPEIILEYRSLEKLRGTYVDALPKLVHPETGRIHSSFNQAVTATGRLSSSDPNLQNIPVRTTLGKRIREGFVPGGADRRLISADYSQIELRIMAHLSGDEALCAAFLEDADIHRETAAKVFNTRPENVSAEMRRQAKAVNFGVIYGISAFGLARNLGIANNEAARFIEAYFNQYPGVRHWLDETLERAYADGYVTTLLQRRRYLPELKSSDVNVRRAAERAAVNTPVQGTAADMIKLAMVRVDEALADTAARLVIQVHDELLVEAPRDTAESTADTVRRIMTEAVVLDVPVKTDIGIGANWAEIH
jgi:DNA polymerase I